MLTKTGSITDIVPTAQRAAGIGFHCIEILHPGNPHRIFLPPPPSGDACAKRADIRRILPEPGSLGGYGARGRLSSSLADVGMAVVTQLAGLPLPPMTVSFQPSFAAASFI